jgi:hypothetical protein
MDTSNIGQVTRFLEGFVDSFDFTRAGDDQSLGRDVVNKVVDRIQARSLHDRRGATDEWAPNSEKYRQWKEKNYGTGDPNSRTGQMLGQKSLFGRTRIEPKEVTMIYGINQPPD